MLVVCLALALALHALLLVLPSGERARLSGGPSAPQPTTTLHVQIAAAPEALESPAVAQPPRPTPAEPPATTPLRATPPPITAMPTVVEAPAATASRPASASVIAATGGEPRGGRDMDYVPPALLTVTPKPVAPINVPFPSSVPGEVHLRAELSLFIDEQGVVQRVRVDGPPLPPVLDDAARTTFLQARFTPGEVNGHAVRSLIRVEVSFDSDVVPLSAPAASSAR